MNNYFSAKFLRYYSTGTAGCIISKTACAPRLWKIICNLKILLLSAATATRRFWVINCARAYGFITKRKTSLWKTWYYFYRMILEKNWRLRIKLILFFSIENKNIVIIDDLWTGRTIRAALDALQDFESEPSKSGIMFGLTEDLAANCLYRLIIREELWIHMHHKSKSLLERKRWKRWSGTCIINSWYLLSGIVNVVAPVERKCIHHY